MLPDFLIIGCQKGGTSSAVVNLNQHSKINCFPREIHFFDVRNHWVKGVSWHEDKFKAMRVKHPQALVGEKSPGYFFYEQSHARMKQVIPNAKLILILRDPVQRAISQWNMMKRMGTVHKGINQLLIDNFRRWRRAKNSWHGIVQRGIYRWRLERLYGHFPKEQVYITVSERVRAKNTTKCLNFLGLVHWVRWNTRNIMHLVIERRCHV